MAERLQEAQQANHRLLRDVSHELRSPLARLRVALEIARNKDKNQVVEELNRIELESERLEKLIDEVLSLLRESSSGQQLKMQQFDLSELLEDLVDSVNYETANHDIVDQEVVDQDIVDQERVDDGGRVELTIQPPLLLDADRELLWRVFENLLRNAVNYAGETGDAETGEIRVSASAVPDQKISIKVSDSGPGIAEHHLDRIFEPFYRVDEARSRTSSGRSSGHGLGLAIAASAVRRHGGRIVARNRSEGGLEVTVILPISQKQ
jgi:two-component system sensor histidine kinase CpxA